ncbi:O-antigen ligase family protein [Clostridium sp.]|uniref:O-antigen ligase family protein n=1 Tax=Clostridium sp. TaxID=1506 RepID=UPI003D6C72F1
MSRFKNYIEYLCIYLVLMIPQSLMSMWYEKETKILFVGLTVFILFINVKRIRINIKKCIIDLLKLLIVMFILLSLVLHTRGDFSLNDLKGIILNQFVFIYIIFQIYKKEFVTDYIKIICFLAIVSLVCFTIQVVDKGYIMRAILPDLSIKSNYINLGEVRGGFLYVFNNGIHKGRNCGVYPEPGMYQFFLNLGLYFLIFVCKELNNKTQIIYGVILIVAILTTQSTTGYISLVIILFLYITQRHINIKIKTQIIALVLVVLSIILLIPGLNNKVFNVVNSKIRISNSTNKIKFLSTGSGGTRINDAKQDIKIILQDNYGIGYKAYSSLWAHASSPEGGLTNGSSSNSLTYTIAVYGMFFSVYMIMLYFIYFLRYSKNFNQALLLMLFFLNTVTAQGLFLNPLFVIFIFSDSLYLYRGEAL